MADKRIIDLPATAAPGADYYLVTDSAADGARKLLVSNVISGGSFSSTTLATATIPDRTALFAIQRSAPTATTLTLPTLANQVGKLLALADFSTGVTNHTITITPSGGATIMQQASWTITSSSNRLASITLRPSTDLNNWVVEPIDLLFQQSGTGAVSRTVQDKNREIFSVKDFGPAANGTTDDTAAFSAAAKAATAVALTTNSTVTTGQSCKVFVPAGTYLLSSLVDTGGRSVDWILEDGASITNLLNLNGRIMRESGLRMARYPHYGCYDTACSFSVTANYNDDEPPAITGISSNSQISTYASRDSVAAYIANTAPAALYTLAPLSAPTNGALSATAGGTLAATTYYVRSTWVNASGETLGATETSLAVAANNVLNVAAPGSPPYGATGWNVYVSTAAGTETKQNSAALGLTTAWVEPTTGLIAGAALPATNTAATMPFTAGKTLTGQSSGATATIVKVITSGTTGTLWINGITGTFTGTEIIKDNNTPTAGYATANGAPTLLYSAMTGVAPSSLTYNWVYKSRLFYVQANSLNAWYLPAGAITGAATQLPLGGIFTLGGSLLFGANWSLETGNGGLSEQWVACTTEGEVAVYQGSDPSAASTWTKVGVYKIGKPLGPNAWFRAGGDIVIATDIGLIPLSTALQKDFSVLAPNAVSAKIETIWNKEVTDRRSGNWNCAVWSANQIAVVAPATVNNKLPVMYAANTRTGAWGRITGWDSLCLCVFQNRMFFGSHNGRVVEANVTGLDITLPYTGSFVPLFSSFENVGYKITGMTRVVFRSNAAPADQLSMQSDFNVSLPASPAAAPISSSDTWNSGVWGTAKWDATISKSTYEYWRSTPGTGVALAPAVQVTSGNLVPLDTEILRVDVTYQNAGVDA